MLKGGSGVSTMDARFAGWMKRDQEAAVTGNVAAVEWITEKLDEVPAEGRDPAGPWEQWDASGVPFRQAG